MSGLTFDVIVCGAGSAGASAAYHLSRLGLSVLVIDARARELVGSQWVNGVPLWMFERAALPWPAAPELREENPLFSLRTPSGREFLRLKAPLANIDMRMLSNRLLLLAEVSGAQIWDRTEVLAPIIEADRVIGVKIKRARHRTEELVHAPLIIDALNGKRVLVSELSKKNLFPSPQAFELCDASQQVRKIKNLDHAQNFLEQAKAKEGWIISTLGVEGGWSVLNVQINLKRGSVELLAGAIAQAHLRSGQKIIADFVREQQSWIGELEFGGRGKIPLRKCYDRPFAPGLIALGGAACMVFPMHASGVGPALVAGKLLAEALTYVRDLKSDELGPLFKELYDRELGQEQKFYSMAQVWSQKLTSRQIEYFFRLKIFPSALFAAAFEEKLPLANFRMAKIVQLFQGRKI